MSVTLRKKTLASGDNSLYLDYYKDGVRKYEFLKLKIYHRPKNESQKQHNKDNMLLAESIRSKRELQLNTREHNLESIVQKEIDLLTYYQQFTDNYPKKDKRLVTASLKHFQAFIGKSKLKPSEVTEQLCIDFKEYLCQKLQGETPANYFSKFKRMLRQAVREKVFSVSPASDIFNRKDQGVKKDILSSEEIQKLATATCGNEDVKRAFLFACNTGLRYCDIKEITWVNINDGILKVTQAKTGKPVIMQLNKSAQRIIGSKGTLNEKLFKLPSHTAISKSLKNWGKRAGIQKHITFHVARHSFATNLIIYGNDVNTVSSLVGHSSLIETQKYVRVVKALQDKAVNSLPELLY
jgi:integrase/recombinase XerD